jgi:formylglycine-generating enzyme required for sulfatase activity
MTEMEYEKACRGPAAPVAGEYAWGSTNKLAAPVAAAAASNFVANLAPNSGLSREQTGASCWGILNLSGSLWDRVVTIDNSTGYPNDKGRQFRGTHGAGTPVLPADWPDKSGNGAGFRGGAAGLAPTHMGVSDRYSAAYMNGSRGQRNGFRAVRSAP